MSDKIVRSKTGKYHIGSQNAAICNGRTGRFAVTTIDQAKLAAPSSFCAKCFPLGLDDAIQYGNLNGE